MKKNFSKSKSPIKVSLKRFILLFALLLIIIALTGIIVQSLQSVDVQVLTENAIQNNLQSDTYRFKTQSILHIGSEERCFTDLSGEKAGARDRHIQGVLVGTEIDMYYIDGVMYRKDSINGEWVALSVGELENAVNIMNEIEPAINFALQDIGVVTDCGREKFNGENCYVVSFMPQLSDEWVQTYFGNIEYKLWIAGKKEPRILKAVISGDSLENPQAGLTMYLEYSDYGADIVLEAPIENEKDIS